MQTHILYHAKCPDGLLANHICRLALPADVVSIPCKYQTPAPTVRCNSKIFIVDFMVTDAEIRAYESIGCEIVVLDHHKAKFEELTWMMGVSCGTCDGLQILEAAVTRCLERDSPEIRVTGISANMVPLMARMRPELRAKVNFFNASLGINLE